MRKWNLLGVIAAMTVCSHAWAWSLKEAAAPYKGTSITVVGLDRPSYKAAQELAGEFTKETGINVNWAVFPYEDSLK
jgi:multiple sugar transport system substrate-binding protein